MAVARRRTRKTPDDAGLDTHTASELAAVFKALADPTRLRLIAALLDGEQCVHELTEHLAMQQSAVSHQLRTLRHVYYALDDSHVRRLFDFALEHVAHTA